VPACAVGGGDGALRALVVIEAPDPEEKRLLFGAEGEGVDHYRVADHRRDVEEARALKPQWSWTKSKGRSASSIESKAEAT
jgi:hypothetical protein